MVVNKESAKKVSEYVRKITMEWLNTGGSKQSALVNPKARYSFQAFCAENKLLEGATYRANDIVIACPTCILNYFPAFIVLNPLFKIFHYF